jgi:hypothetical protein
MVQREEEGDRARRQRQPDEPAAHSPSPSATGDARRSDERRRQGELERQAVQ